MKKGTILTLICMILVCGIVYCVLSRESSEIEVKEQLLDREGLEDIDEIQVEGLEEDSYTILRTENMFFLKNAPEIEISTAYLTAIWDVLTQIEASGRVEPEVDTSEAGFDTPTVKINYCSKSETTTSIEAGRYSKVRDAYYVRRIDSDSDVYLVDAETVEMIVNAKQEFYVKTLLDFWSEDDYDRLTSVEVTGHDADFLDIKIEADNTWFHMSQPINYICDYKTLKTTFLDNVMRLKGTEYVSDSIDETMGFDDPRYVINYVYDGKEIQVLVGNSENGMSYICRVDQGIVFQIDDIQLEFLKKDYREYIGDSCYSRYINFVDSFSIEYKENTEEFDLENAADYSDKWLALHNGKTYDYEEFIGLYNAVMGVPRKGTIQKEYEETNPEERVTLYVKLKSGDTDTVRFMKINSREYKVVVNDDSYFTASAAGVEEILTRLNTIK